VTVCATNNSCYSFVNWTVNSSVVSTSTCYTFTATNSETVVANFTPIAYTINTASSPAAGGSASGGGTEPCGSNVTVCATNNSCYSFVNWTVNSSVVSTSACYTFSAANSETVVANFTPIAYTINTASSPAAGGSASGGGTEPCGSNVTVCATNNSCYSFVNWTVNSSAVSTSACYTFTATNSETVVANFAALTYTINTSSSPTNGGSTSGGGTEDCGSNVTVCATNNANYSFVNWTDQNSNVLSTTACYSFTATTNLNLVANFTSTQQGPPSAPPIIIATGVSSNRVNLSWASATGTVGVVYYQVYQQALGSTNFVQIGTTTNTTSFSATGLTANTNYTYRVQAMDSAGSGPYSTLTSATTLPHLAAGYAFDAGSGTTVADISGNGNTGTISGATWTNAGKYGNALVFDGSSALVTINDASSLDLTTGMTLEAWVNTFQVGAFWQDVIYKDNVDYYLEATGNLPPYTVPAGGGTYGGGNANVFGVTELTTNTWTHLALTYNGASLLFYVNGVQVGALTTAGNIETSSSPLQIGGDTDYGQFFQGIIDEVRVYGVALTPTQIMTDMNTPLGSIPSAPGSLTATPMGTNQVNLLWTASTDSLAVTNYLVEREGPGSTNFVQIGTTAATSYSDTGLTLNGYCSYRVRAQDSAGNLGPYSSVAQANTGLSITPRAAVLTVTRTQQFATSYTSNDFVWAVDGVTGGASTSGTITAGGLYSPPTNAGTHAVTVSDQARSATATVYVSVYPGTYTYHNDNLRTGQNTNETALTPSNVNSTTFGKLFSYALDGIAFASPLYVANVSIPGHGFHNVVYVATENDSVYAFDADGLTNAPLWHVNFVNPAAGTTNVPCTSWGGCDDIPNEFGITSTPVIDPSNGTLYVVGTVEVTSNTTYVQQLYALDIATGTNKFGGPVAIQGSVSGTGTGSVGGQVAFSPQAENQRTALLLANGVVYFGFGSHGDVEPYFGWMMGYNATNLQQTLLYNSAPNGTKAGIWMNGDGAASDATGNVYFITGDGTLTANTGGKDYGDSFIKITPSGAVADYFTPDVENGLDQSNLDLGSGGVLLLPDQSGTHPHEMVSAGKNSTVYLLNRDNMGHYAASSNAIIQSITSIFYNYGDLGYEGGNFSSPVYFNGTVYFAPNNNNIWAFQLTNGLLSTSPTSLSPGSYAVRGGTMAISANGNSNGILWSLQSAGTLTPGLLHAYSTVNLTNEFYNSNIAGTRDTLDIWLKFTAPVIANGKVFVTSMSQLTVYGLLP
jgi:hypothetical protein